MRLAVNTGSIQEDADQRGLAHFLEHMAFNGTENFKPGELVSFLETIGARFGPHVNASTSFDETIYMLDIPTDRPGYVDKGMLVLHDFAAGLSLLPAEIEKERGVVLEEWRGRLGAGSRLTDIQLPIIFQGSKYAERLPIGLPEVLKNAPREKLRGVLPEVVPPRSDGGGRGRRHSRRRSRAADPEALRRDSRGEGRRIVRRSERAGPQGDAHQHGDRPGSAGLVGVDGVQGQGRPRPHRRRLSQVAREATRVADAEPAVARDRAPAQRAVPRRAGRQQRHRPHARAVRDRGVGAGGPDHRRPRCVDGRGQAHAAVRVQRRRAEPRESGADCRLRTRLQGAHDGREPGPRQRVRAPFPRAGADSRHRVRVQDRVDLRAVRHRGRSLGARKDA